MKASDPPCRQLYRAEQVRELDRRTIEDHGISGYQLMQRAGHALFTVLRARWPEARSVTVCCGGGNNAGDGYVVASLARDAGLTVQVIALKPPGSLSGDARRAADDFLAGGGQTSDPPARRIGDVIVDALIGTGLDQPVRQDYARLIRRMNECRRPILAVDVPSGLNADTGMPMGECVRAAVTVSFIGNKRGLFTGQAGDWVGEPVFDSLGAPGAVRDRLEADALLLVGDHVREHLPRRPASVHKGQNGHVLLAGGNRGMAGAVLLAARSALRAGAGLVSVVTRAEHTASLAASLPEAMWHAPEAPNELRELLDRSDVVALGPGLGRSGWSRSVVEVLVDQPGPLVVDADGLNLLASEPFRRDRWVLTPHPGEAARLLDVSAEEVQSDRFAACRELAERFGAVCVLKGHGTLVAEPGGRLAVCPYGNAAMATAGMGDALTGVIAALLAQGLSPFEASCCGVVIHGRAGDRAANGRRQILVSDLIEQLPVVMY